MTLQKTPPEEAGMPADSVQGPLRGIRVIELGSLVAGPFGGRLLADLGAEVIKVETPDRPDPLRQWGHEQAGGKSLWWVVQSRNKKCVTINLRREAGQRLFLDLAREADVVLENLRPGTLEGWGVGYEQLREVRPDIILTRVSGYGQTGPYAGRAGFASVAEAMGGLRHINGFPDEPPPRGGISLGDSLGGLFATIGTLAALRHRDQTGEGQVVDVSLMESCFALMESALPEYDVLGRIREPSGTTLKGIAPSNIFRSAEGNWMVIAANSDNLFRRLCETMGKPELADHERFADHLARGENQEELDSIIAGWAATKSWHEIDKLLNEAGVVCGPIYTIADIAADPQYKDRGAFVEHHDETIGTFLGPGVIPRFSATPGGVAWSGSSEPGSHNREVLGDLLDLDDEALDSLREEGVL
ncbi:MAG TPA: CoA transferase [Solirubrobacterales bacterium]